MDDRPPPHPLAGAERPELESIFPGRGEMAQLCRSLDWTSTALGPVESWPSSLVTLVRTLLTSRLPMLLWWGPEFVQIYNDAYRTGFGENGSTALHPRALAMPGDECWGGVWHEVVKPELERVLVSGEATWHQTERLPPSWDTVLAPCWWSCSFGPTHDDDGRVAGVLAIMQEAATTGPGMEFETLDPLAGRWSSVRDHASEVGPAVRHEDATERRRLETELREREQLLSMAGRMARVGGWSLDVETDRFHLSEEVCRIHGVPPGTEFTPIEALARIGSRWRPQIEQVFARLVQAGEPVDQEVQIERSDGRRTWVRIMAEPLEDETGELIRIQGALQDIQRQKETEAALRESGRNFRELAESMPLLVWGADALGQVDFHTGLVEEFTGLSPRGFHGEQWLQAIHPDDRGRAAEAWAESVRTGESYAQEFRIRRRDGAWRWHLTRAQFVRGESGRPDRWYGTSTNIHEQFQLRREAERAAERLTRTLESITDAFYLLDTEWRFAFLNRQAEHLLERTREDLLGRLFWDELPETAGSMVEEEYRQARETGRTADFTFFYQPLHRWFAVKAYPSAEGLAVYFRDVSEEVETNQRLREQAELLDRSQDAILVLDHQGSITFWNASAERIYGWERTEVRGRSFRSLLHDAYEDVDAAIAQVVDSGEWTGELEQRRRDGSTITVEGRWSLVRDDEGWTHRILAIHTDITERKRLLAQFLRAQRMESIGTLAGGIAHDLNNVLAPILLSIEMLKLETENPETLETLTTIEGSARRGADMVQQVLGFARGFDRKERVVNIQGVVSDLERVIRDTFPRSVDIRVHCPGDLWRILGDRTQIHQVLMNLALNARDALPQGGELGITLSNVVLHEHHAGMSGEVLPGPHVKISVVDTGSGMSKEILDRIFDPFFTTKEVGRGTGLGLSTVAAIVRAHGGCVTATSEPGNGTAFHVYLPAREEREEGAMSAAAVESLDLATLRGDGELILVVDDESSVREITRQTLETFGYRVVTARHGADAVAIYAQRGREIAMVLTDMVMPIMDGPATILALKGLDPEVRIITASGVGTREGVARATELGSRSFLQKPYTAKTLLEAIRGSLKT